MKKPVKAKPRQVYLLSMEKRFRVIITDDEAGARQVLRTLLTDFFPELELLAECEDLPQCVKAIQKYKPDLVFMDIEMPGYSGLEVHQFLNPEDIRFELIFTTAYQGYAIEAFRLAAIDYLLKPIQFNQLQEAIQRFKDELDKSTALEQLELFKKNLSTPADKRICISTSEGKYYVPLDELIVLEADGSYTRIHTLNQGVIYAGRRLKFFEEMLKTDRHFLRPHRSFLVNIRYVQRLVKGDEPHVLLSDNQQIPVSGERLKELEMHLTK